MEDHGEPGAADLFRLRIAGIERTGTGELSGDDIQVHEEAAS